MSIDLMEGLSVSFAGEPCDSSLLLGILTPPTTNDASSAPTLAALRGSADTILSRLSDCAAAAELTLSVGEPDAPPTGKVEAYLTWLVLMNGPGPHRLPVRQRPIRVGGVYCGKALSNFLVDGCVTVRLAQRRRLPHTFEWLRRGTLRACALQPRRCAIARVP